MTCRRGHEFRGDENYRARRGWCPVCFNAALTRYNRSPKKREADARYEQTDKAADRKARYRESPAGWKQALADRRAKALRRRADRVTNREAEDPDG